MSDLTGFMLLMFGLLVLIIVAILRRALRINTIVDRLDRIVYLLDGKPKKPTSFMDGFKKGMGE